VVVFAEAGFAEQWGTRGIAVRIDFDGASTVLRLAERQRPDLKADIVQLHRDLDLSAERWLADILPGARNVVVVPFAIAQASGALVIEQPRRRFARYSRRVERSLIATARQAVAQSAMAFGRAMATMKLAAAAHIDGLTGLVNRGRFDSLLTERISGTDSFSLILLDLDHFKAVNDTHGHQVGDAVLRSVSTALREVARQGDIVARYGGEEIVLLCAGHPAEVHELSERFRRAVETAPTPVPMTASLGAARFPSEETTVEGLIEAADQRLYVAKRGGRNRVITSADDVLAQGSSL
jgi:two-component system cell cycle response regulator